MERPHRQLMSVTDPLHALSLQVALGAFSDLGVDLLPGAGRSAVCRPGKRPCPFGLTGRAVSACDPTAAPGTMNLPAMPSSSTLSGRRSSGALDEKERERLLQRTQRSGDIGIIRPAQILFCRTFSQGRTKAHRRQRRRQRLLAVEGAADEAGVDGAASRGKGTRLLLTR